MNTNHKDEGMHCPYCSARSRLLFSVGDINHRMSDEIFDYYRCDACGLIFLANIPEDIQGYYGHEYSAYQKAEGGRDISGKYDQGKIETVKQYAQGNKLLEIGPGNGDFAYLAKREGFIVDAIEMDAECSRHLAEDIQIRSVINTSDIVGALAGIEVRYDVIVMWHVLEHLERPWEILNALPKMLAPNGVIIIAVPNPDALQFRLFKEYWKHVDAPRHMMFFPSHLLAKTLESAGLQRLRITTDDQVSSIFDSYGWWAVSAKNYVLAGMGHALVRALLDIRIIRYVVYYLLIRPLERSGGRGNTYLAVFRKPDSL
jgi:2-polyprenyl-3-methyl-5-hydroxy-6-metoxy-1,4-benzoquinol methylase